MFIIPRVTGGCHSVISHPVLRKITRKQFIKGLGATLLLGSGTVLYTLFVEPHWLEVIEHEMPVKNLPDSLIGKKIVQLSDIHIGQQVSDAYLKKAFDVVRSLSPDVVVYTGDFTTREPETLAHAGRIFPHLPVGKMGAFGIFGNHDYGRNWHEYDHANRLAMLAESHGIRMLRNEMAEVGGLQIIGLDDLWASQFKPEQAFARWNAGAPSIVLTHNPDTVDLQGWGNYQGWILAGHTHGGQCKPPFLPPPMLPVKNRRYCAGTYDLEGGRKLYINRGLGHLVQAIFNARPEITVFKLSRA